MENLADLYYEKLSTSTNAGLTLAQFYCELFSITITKAEVILFNRLLKLFGRYTVYFAILDLYGYEEANLDNVYGLLSYYCKKRVEAKNGPVLTQDPYVNLNSRIEKIGKQIESQKKTKIEIRGLE